MVAQFVCDTKARSSSVGVCHVAFECWADGRPEQNRFSVVGTVADDWTVNIAATNVLQLCQVCLFLLWSGAKHGRVTRQLLKLPSCILEDESWMNQRSADTSS